MTGIPDIHCGRTQAAAWRMSSGDQEPEALDSYLGANGQELARRLPRPGWRILLALMWNSDEVLAAMLSLGGRGEAKTGGGLDETREPIFHVLDMLDRLVEPSEAEPAENE